MSTYLRKNWQALVYAALLCGVVAIVYSLGLKNELIFDDERLTDNSVFVGYSDMLQLKERLLSYGSFNWVRALAGTGFEVQRLVNVLLHLCTCWALYHLFAALIARIDYSREHLADRGITDSQRAALQLGVLVFALHPVAAYAVGYLIQRTIVMATLFGVLACWAFVRALTERKLFWHVAALVFYLFAVESKEHVFLLAAMAAPLYVFLRRPRWQRTAAMVGIAAVILFGILAVLLSANFYEGMLGQVFDGTSKELAAQLGAQQPAVLGQMYALSILNEAALFFYYGALWLLPYPGWMSIDMHPPFPLSMASMPHLLGAAAYVAVLVTSVIALLRKSDVWGFVGLCMLFPLVLYWTEFSTVWVQDSFVLYRSYLWAIPIPALVALVLTGFSPRTLYKVSVVVGLALGTATTDRVLSMRNDQTVWTDVADKTEVPGAPNAVGRGRAFMNLGMNLLKRSELEMAMKDFGIARRLGAVGGAPMFAIGMTQNALRKPDEALQSLQQAEAAGYSGNLLHFHRGESLYALGKMAEAMDSYTKALAPTRARSPALGDLPTEQAREHRAEAAMRLQRFAEAKSDYEALLARNPKEPRDLMGLGLAQLGLKDATAALATFEILMQAKPDALAFYGRALAHHSLGEKAAAQDDIARAVQLEPSNAIYKQVQESIKKGERLSL